MSISLGKNVLALLLLLLLPIVGGIPSAAGQNALSNTTASDIIDLFGNVIESEGQEEEEGQEEAIEDLSSSTFVSDADDDTSSVTAGDSILINEVELNPSGNDMEEGEWIELYNPTDVDINISGSEIRTSSKSATIKLSQDAVIEAGETYVIELDSDMLSNTAERLTLADATGNIIDRTPSLVDRNHDEHTWQRIPDGNNEWQFLENTKGKLNDPNATRNDNVTYRSYSSNSEVHCLGSAGCLEGVAIRIVDADTLYVGGNSKVYKVDLALTQVPAKGQQEFMEATSFTRDLCIGSDVLIDQDDNLLTSTGSSIIAVVYCSGINLNSELLNNGYADLDAKQCDTSKFANQPWAIAHGC